MTAINRTAYPRLDARLNQEELGIRYTQGGKYAESYTAHEIVCRIFRKKAFLINEGYLPNPLFR
jgi:hypothetical protein